MGSEVIKNFGRTFTQAHVGAALLIGMFLVLLTYFTASDQFNIRALTGFSPFSPENPSNTSLPMEDNLNSSQLGAGTKNSSQSPPPPPPPPPSSSPPPPSSSPPPPPPSSSPPPPPPPPPPSSPPPPPPSSSPPPSPPPPSPPSSRPPSPPQHPSPKPICDLSDRRYDVCDMVGDARTLGNFSVVLFVPPPQTPTFNSQEWTIRTQSRKVVRGIKEVTVKHLRSSQEAPRCTVNHTVPAIVFSVGGLIDNFWHSFTDLIIPLFINSRAFDGEVQFLLTDFRPPWVAKFDAILKQLSRYGIINFDKDKEIRCFPRVTVGLRSHRDLDIDPSRAPNGYTMVDFRLFVRKTYSLGPDVPVKLEKGEKRKPRLLLISRRRTRTLTNLPEVVRSAERSGFEVVTVDPKFDDDLASLAKLVNTFDVLMGVHGAGLTNIVFLRTNAIFIQIVPYGKLERMCMAFFGQPAKDMKLRYLEYSIGAEETSLLEKYGRDDPIVKDPDAIHKSGWRKVGEYYMAGQNVTLDVKRFAPVLLNALELLRQ
ncbi:beta-1,2-xylosyltransferase XYXT1-like isoform X2 [Typha latifolia]|uniref:beta-1,2-xylosyltransferase XYXT1-like isoform X2 n=1 Tax=Typha latifolia TaxID=4733 RepID=UPI003C2D6195